MRYFVEKEFACNHCGKLPSYGMSEILMDKLNELRGLVGYPIYVTSGYRCPEWNSECGGVDNSQHVLGTAADIYCEHITTKKLAEYAEQVGFDGIGIYYDDEFVHVDCRNDGRSPNYYRW